eukprot:PhF_6_TR20471/c0_g1_i1/m.29447
MKNRICPHNLSADGCKLGSYCQLVHVNDEFTFDRDISSSSNINSGIMEVTPLWWWRENTCCYTEQPNEWHLFPMEQSRQLEDAFVNGRSCILRSHRVNFKTMKMNHLSESGATIGTRMIERVLSVPSASWFTLTLDGKHAVQFDEDTCILLENLYCQGTQTRVHLRIGIHGLYINFVSMEVRDPSTSSVLHLRRQSVRLNCSTPNREIVLVDEYKNILFIFDAFNRCTTFDFRQLTAKPQGMLYTNELIRVVVVETCTDNKCIAWKKSFSHMKSYYHPCPKGRTCPLSVSSEDAEDHNPSFDVWSDIHCALFHHENMPHSEPEAILHWRRSQGITKQFRRKWVETKTLGNRLLRRVPPVSSEYTEILNLLVGKGLDITSCPKVKIDRVQNNTLWSSYLRLRQEIAETMLLGEQEYAHPPHALQENIYFLAVAEKSELNKLHEKGFSELKSTQERHSTRVCVEASSAVEGLPDGQHSGVIVITLGFVGWSVRVVETTVKAVAPPVRLLTSKGFSRKMCALYDSTCDSPQQSLASYFEIYDTRQLYPMYVVSYDYNAAFDESASQSMAFSASISHGNVPSQSRDAVSRTSFLVPGLDVQDAFGSSDEEDG